MSELYTEYLDNYVKNTESPTIYHRWSLITAVAALLGRNFYFPYGHATIFPNQFCMLIGTPGTRKTTAIKITKKLIELAGYETIASGRTTKEKFLLDLYGEPDEHLPTSISTLIGKTDDEIHEIMVAADEFNNFCGLGNYEFLSLLGELWDCPESLPVRTKTSKSFNITRPVVNIIAGNTHAGFTAAFPPEMIGQGFLSRLILVYGENHTKITWPTVPDEAQTIKLVEHLRDIKMKVFGAATMTNDAKVAIDYLYQHWTDLPDSRLAHYSARRIVHLLKLCLIHAAMRLSTEITLEDVVLSNTILTWTEAQMPRALGEFGRSKNSDVTSKILDALAVATEPQTVQDLYKLVAMDLERYGQMPELLTGLLQAEKIQRVGNGFLLKLATIKETGKYLDLSLLKEAAITTTK